LTKLTLKNIPNLWGALLMGAYFLFGSPIPKAVKTTLAEKGGPQAPALASTALHLGLGMLMSIALFVPLLTATDPDFPMRSRYTTLFESLGRSINAPVMSSCYQLVQQTGPVVGYLIIGLIVIAIGLGLGAAGIAFGKFKDRIYEELGLVKYTIVISLYLMMLGVLGKIVLRLLFGVKYLFSLPTFNFNI
jgi:hypothetical protein